MIPSWQIILGTLYLLVMGLTAAYAREFTISAIYMVGFWIVLAIYDSMRDD